MNAKQIMGTVTIIAIVGGTIYAIKKSKDAKKNEGEAISLAEARKIVDDSNFKSSYPTYFEDKDIEEMNAAIAYSEEDVKVTARLMADLEENDEEEEALYSEEEYVDEDKFDEQYETLMDSVEARTKEEVDDLRYEPNSREARNQFIKMELADWVPLEDEYQILNNLFEFPFEPQNDGDYDLRTRLMDFRAQFFGHASKWTRDVSYADVILHYARAAEFNCGESVKYWADYFLEFNAIDINTPSRVIDDVLLQLNKHVFFNEERATFGLFGLTRESMDQAIQIANRNVDSSVTYEIEFNEFLKSCV